MRYTRMHLCIMMLQGYARAEHGGASAACVDDAYVGWQATTRTRQGLPTAKAVRQVSSREEQNALDDRGLNFMLFGVTCMCVCVCV